MRLADLPRVPRGFLVVLAGAALLLPAFAPTYWAFLASSVVIWALLVVSVGVVFGNAGQITLCQIAFAGVGSWTVGVLELHTALPLAVKLVIGALAAVPIGILIGLPALRLRGVNLAVVTLTFAAAMQVVVFDEGFPGGSLNRAVARPTVFASEGGYYLFALLVFVAVTLALTVIRRQRFGLAWWAVRRSERAAAAMGLSVPATKLGAFAVGAFVAGLGGGLLAGQLGLLGTRNFDPMQSLILFALAVMVGGHLLEGTLLAGLLIAVLPELLRRVGLPQDVAPMLFAVGAVQALAQGQDGVAADLRARLRRRLARVEPAPARDPDPPHPPATVASLTPRRAPDAAPPSVLDVRDLTVRFGSVTALDGVDLTVGEGEVSALIGPNGAGKSTLIDAVTGFVAAEGGTVRLDGVALDRLPAHRRARAGIRRSFQQERTVGQLRVGAYVALAAARRLGAEELEELLTLLGCPPPQARLQEVDVGTRRLVEIAGCLAARPRIVLLDEPAAGLGPAQSEQLAERLRVIPARFGCAVLVIEHDMDLVAAACERVTVLDFGQVIASGPTEDVLRETRVIAAYLGEEQPA